MEAWQVVFVSWTVILLLISSCTCTEEPLEVIEQSGVKIERMYIPKSCDFQAEHEDMVSIHCKSIIISF